MGGSTGAVLDRYSWAGVRVWVGRTVSGVVSDEKGLEGTLTRLVRCVP